MKKLLPLLGLFLLCVSCDNGGQKQAGHPQSFDYAPDFKVLKVDESRLERIDALLQEYVDNGLLPHALTFVAKDGQVIHHKAFGWRNLENRIPLEKDDIFIMYSQTKAVTTISLMTLYEQGKFQLDDPVSKYIPEMTDRVYVDANDRNNNATREAASPVTIRHLLCHTSGISGHRFVPGQQRSRFETLADYVKDLVQAPLIFDPGTDFNYHPASDVVAYLVEYFSGKTLQDYFKEVIFEPLGIVDMAHYFDISLQDRFVTVYNERNGKLEPARGGNQFSEDRRYAAGAIGLYGTIEGYARMLQMVLNYGEFNGKRILGRRTIELMKVNQLPTDGAFQFGLGFQIQPAVLGAREDILSPLAPGGVLAWGGMANTDYIIDHTENMIILLYTNRMPDTMVWEKFLNTVYQALE